MNKVSIIIPAYNQAQYLVQAIESALQQAGREVEVVVVNDGSTDTTAEVMARYAKHPNFKGVHQANAGLPATRNRGIPESTGEYLCFLDSDDYYHPEKVRKQAELLDADPNLGFVYCNILNVDEQGQPLADQYSVKVPGRQLSGNIFHALMMGGYFPPHTVMIRRSILDKVGPFDPELGGHADYELWLRVSGAGYRACYVDEQLAYYRHHPDNMTKDGLHMAETRQAAYQKIVRLYPQAVAEAVEWVQRANRDFWESNEWWQSFTKKLETENGNYQAQIGTLQQNLQELQSAYNYLNFLNEGKAPPEWLRRLFEKTLSGKLRSSIRKRIRTVRGCFDEPPPKRTA